MFLLTINGCNKQEKDETIGELKITAIYDCMARANDEEVFFGKYFQIKIFNESIYLFEPRELKLFILDEFFKIKQEIDFSNDKYRFVAYCQIFEIGKTGNIYLHDHSDKIIVYNTSGHFIKNIDFPKEIKNYMYITNINEISDSTIVLSYELGCSFLADRLEKENIDSITLGAIINIKNNTVRKLKINTGSLPHKLYEADKAFCSVFSSKISFYFQSTNKVKNYDLNGVYLDESELEINNELYAMPKKVNGNENEIIGYLANNRYRPVYDNKFYFTVDRFPKATDIIIYDDNIRKIKKLQISDEHANIYPTDVYKLKDKYLLFFAYEPIIYFAEEINQ